MKLDVVFMGTPDFALPVLGALCDNFNVILCVTKADKPKGRGGKVTKSPVKIEAEKRGIPVLSPEKVKTPEFLEEIGKYRCDFFVTCAYGKILPQAVLDIPKYGTVIVHASLLPAYRGAAPIWRAVMNGEKETGVTTMLTDAGMDTGAMLLSEKVEIGPDMTTGELHDALAPVGARLVVETLNGLVDGTITPVPQDDALATYAKTVEKEDGLIDWTKPAQEVHNLVRGCEPVPGAFTFLDGECFKIRKTRISESEFPGAEPGRIAVIGKNSVTVACGTGAVEVLEIQKENSKRMPVGAYLNGHELEGVFGK